MTLSEVVAYSVLVRLFVRSDEYLDIGHDQSRRDRSWRKTGSFPSSLVVVSTLHRPINCQFASLHNLTADDHFVENLIDFVEVEDEIELAHTPEVLVKHLHEQVDEFKHGQLVVLGIDTQSEKEPRVPPIYNLMIPILCENNKGKQKVRAVGIIFS